MAPERIDADVYYLNSDIWSIGVIILECALGYFPYLLYNNFQPLDNVWILRDLIYNNPIPPIDCDYSYEFKDFIQSCLIKDTFKRPNCAALCQHPFIKKYDNFNNNELIDWLKKVYI